MVDWERNHGYHKKALLFYEQLSKSRHLGASTSKMQGETFSMRKIEKS